jgi:hypothetical protein
MVFTVNSDYFLKRHQQKFLKQQKASVILECGVLFEVRTEFLIIRAATSKGLYSLRK